MNLYSLNKDLLVKLVATIRDETLNQMSDEELKSELLKRERRRKFEIVKKSLLNLKVVPHLKSLIEKYESRIEKSNNTDAFLDEIFEDFSQHTLNNSRYQINLYIDICNYLDDRVSDNWPGSHKIEYMSCEYCKDHEILLYFEGKINSRFTILGTPYSSIGIRFKNMKCYNCQRKDLDY